MQNVKCYEGAFEEDIQFKPAVTRPAMVAAVTVHTESLTCT